MLSQHEEDCGFEVVDRFSLWQKKHVRTIIVNAHSKTPLHRSVASAIAAAKPYDRIELVGGEYLEALSIPYPLELVASDGEQPHIVSRNTAITITADVKVYFEGVEISSKSKSKMDVGMAVLNGHPTFVNCKFNSILISASGAANIENCTITGSANGIGLAVRDNASGTVNNTSIFGHAQACVEVNTRGSLVFTACAMSNRRSDGGDVFVASGLGNKYGDCEPCSKVVLMRCRLYITNTGGTVKQVLEKASFSIGDPCCVCIINGAAPILEQNRIMEGEVGVLLHHAGGARLSQNLIQCQRRCGIAALLLPNTKEDDSAMFGRVGLSITGDNIIDRCAVGIDIHTRSIPAAPAVTAEATDVETEMCTFSPFAGTLQSFSWLNLPEVQNAKLPAQPKGTTSSPDDTEVTTFQGKKVSIQTMKHYIREVARTSSRAFSSFLKDDFGSAIMDNAPAYGTSGNSFSQLLSNTLDLKLSREGSTRDIPSLAEFAKEISITSTVFNHCGICAVRFGCNSYGSVEGCTFDSNDKHAIIVSSGAYPVITGCTFMRSSGASIVVGSYANPLIIGNEFREDGMEGISVTALGRGVILANNLSDCGGSGITIKEHSEPLIAGNMIRRNVGGGALISQGSRPLIAFNILSVNSNYQILSKAGSDPVVAHNSIQSGLGAGVALASFSRGTFVHNHIISNKCGISIETSADPLIAYNTVERNSDVGISVGHGGLGTIQTNEIFGNGTNVVIQDGGECVLRGNTIYKGGQGGVVVRHGGKGLVVKNYMHDNSVANLIISGAHSDPLCIRNKICTSSSCGVIVTDQANGKLLCNRIYENGMCGIYVLSGGCPTCKENHISREAVGVMVTEYGRGKFVKNEITQVYGIGFMSQRMGQPHVKDNVITHCDLSGLQLGEGTGGLFEANRISENRFGIQVGSVHPAAELPISSAYMSSESERRKSLFSIGAYSSCTVTRNDITANSAGGVLVQSVVGCSIEDNAIYMNHAYGIVGDIQYWEKNRGATSAFANLYSTPRPLSRKEAVPLCFRKNSIRQHTAANVFFDCFNEGGVTMIENDICDAPLGISLNNYSCISRCEGNRVHDCLDGVHVLEGGHGVFSKNTVTDCAHVGLYICQSGRPEWVEGNIIQNCMLCGVLCDWGGGGVVAKSTIRQCPFGVVALSGVGASIYTSHKASAAPTFTVSNAAFEENEICENVIHGVVVLCSRDEMLLRQTATESPLPMKVTKKSRGQIRFVRNKIHSNRGCGVHLNLFSAGDFDASFQTRITLSEMSTRATADALLGTSLLGTSDDHHSDRAAAQSYFEGNQISNCSVGLSVGSLCHPFMKDSVLSNNLFFGATLRSGSAAMMFGGECASNGCAGFYLSDGAKGTVSDVFIHGNNALKRTAAKPTEQRDFSRTVIATVLGLWEGAKGHRTSRPLSVDASQQDAFQSSYCLLNRWMSREAQVMVDTVTILRQLVSSSSVGIGIATSVVPPCKPENPIDYFGFADESRPTDRMVSVSDGGIGVWAQAGTRTVLQRNRVEDHRQAGILFSKGVLSQHVVLQRTCAIKETVTASLSLLTDWDEKNRASATLQSGCFFMGENAAKAPPVASSQGREASPRGGGGSHRDASARGHGDFSPRLTPREVKDNQHSFVVESNTIRGNRDGIHIHLFHSFSSEKAATNSSKKAKGKREKALPEVGHRTGEHAVIVRDNTIHNNVEIGIHCEHVMEVHCRDIFSCSLAFVEAIEAHHKEVVRMLTEHKMKGLSLEPPYPTDDTIPFVVTATECSLSNGRISHNDLTGNGRAQGEVTSRHIIIAKDKSKTLLHLNTFCLPHSSSQASQLLARIPAVAAILQHPHCGSFYWDDNTFHDAKCGWRCFGVVCAESACLARNQFSNMEEDAVVVMGHFAAATIGDGNQFTRNGVGVRICVDVPRKTPSTARFTPLRYQTRLYECVFSDHKVQAVVVNGPGYSPSLVHRNKFLNHAAGSTAILLFTSSGTNAAVIAENEFTSNFCPVVVAGGDGSDAVKGIAPVAVGQERLLISKNYFSHNTIGALLCRGATPRLASNVFACNSRAGLEMCDTLTNPIVEDCVFKNNSSRQKQSDASIRWPASRQEIEVHGLSAPVVVSLMNEYLVGTKELPLGCGVLLNPECQCTVTRCLFDHNDVGVDAVRCVIAPATEEQALFSTCVFSKNTVAGVMSRFGKDARIRESALSLGLGNQPKETTVFEDNFFVENAFNCGEAVGDVVCLSFGAAILRRNIFSGVIHGREDGYAWFDDNSFLPESAVLPTPDAAVVLHNETKIVVSKSTIGKRKTGVESKSYSNAYLRDNVIIQCGTGIRAMPLSFTKFVGNRILDSVINGIVAYSGEFQENQVVFARSGVWVEDPSLTMASNAIPADRINEGRVLLRNNSIIGCEEEGILLSTPAEVASNVVQHCGIGVHVISLGQSNTSQDPSDPSSEVACPLIRSNTIMMNRIGVELKDHTNVVLYENDIFDNTSIGIEVEPLALGTVRTNRISTSQEKDGVCVPLSSKMKLINNVIRHQFSPVFNRMAFAGRKADLSALLKRASAEVEGIANGWDKKLEKQNSLYAMLSSLDTTPAEECSQSLLFAAGSPSLSLRRFSMALAEYAGEAKGLASNQTPAQLSSSSLTSVPFPKSSSLHRRRSLSQLSNSSGSLRVRDPVFRRSEASHQSRASRRGEAIPIVIHVLAQRSAKSEADQWSHRVSHVLSLPPLSAKNFSVRFSSSQEELSKAIATENPNLFVVLVHRSCRESLSSPEHQAALYQLHTHFAQLSSSAPITSPWSPYLLGVFPQMGSRESGSCPEGQMRFSTFSQLHTTLTYDDTVMEVLEAVSASLDDALRVRSGNATATITPGVATPAPSASPALTRRSTMKSIQDFSESTPTAPSPKPFTLDDVARLMSLINAENLVDQKEERKKKKKTKKSHRHTSERRSQQPQSKSHSKSKKPPLAPLANNRIITPLPKLVGEERRPSGKAKGEENGPSRVK